MLNKRIMRTIALLVLPAFMFFTACDPTAIKGSGDIVKEVRNEKDFNGLDVSIPGKVVIHSGTAFKVEVQVEENLLPYLKTDVEAGKLHIYFSYNVRDVDNLVVTVTMPELTSVDLSGSAVLVSNDVFSGQLLDLNVSGSGNIQLSHIDYNKEAAEVSGSGHIGLSGEAIVLEASISGSGQLDALNCPVKNADAHISGSGSVKLNVSDLLKANISGSGDVMYTGNPVVVADISGSGSVQKI